MKNIVKYKGILLIASAVMLAVAVFVFITFRHTPSDSRHATSLEGKKLHKKDKPVVLDDKEIKSLINTICSDYGIISFGNKTKDGKYSTVLHVPQSMHVLTGIDKKATYHHRIDAADAIISKLPSREKQLLLFFLHKRLEDDNLKNLQFNAVKNQVIMALMRQKPFPQELIFHLIAIYNDEKMDMVMRDYCIQFLGQTYGKISEKKYKLAVKKTLFDALKFKQNIAGAAIIAIDGLVEEPEITRAEIAEAAYSLASDEKASHIVKVPALQIAAKHNHPEALNLARSILSQDSRTSHLPVILKMSAIATIGMKGNSEDVALIEKYRKSSDTRLRTAAKAALKKLL